MILIIHFFIDSFLSNCGSVLFLVLGIFIEMGVGFCKSFSIPIEVIFFVCLVVNMINYID